MTLSLIQSPDQVALAKNPVIIALQTDNMLQTAGQQACYVIYLADYAAIDNAFTLKFGNNSVTFTCKAAPDDTGTQFKAPADGITLSDWIIQTWAYLMKNFTLNQYFTFFYPNPSDESYGLGLLAKEESADFNITLTDNTFADLTLYQVDAGFIPVVRPFFKNYIQVIDHLDNIIVEDSVSPDADGKTYHNIAEYLLPYLDVNFTWPPGPAGAIPMCLDTVKKFRFRFAEKFGNPSVVQGLTTSDEFRAMQAGVSENLYKSLTINNSRFLTKLFASQMFLTWQPDNKKVVRWQPERLYYIIPLAVITSVKLCGIIYYTDGTNQGTNFSNTFTISVTNYQLVEFNVNYDNLAIGTIDISKTVLKYKLCLIDQDANIISQYRTYYIESPGLFDRIFFFRNSLGGYDCFRSTGIIKKNIAVTKTDIKKIFPDYGIDFKTRVKQQRRKSIDTTLTINTGWMRDKLTADWFVNEFLLSEEVYMWYGGNQLFPVIVTSDKQPVYVDDMYQYFAEFTVELDPTDKSYSIPDELLNAGDFNDDFNYDFNNNQS